MHYAWFTWSVLLLLVWTIVYRSLRSTQSGREMLAVSLWTSLLGFTELLFVPSYWNPPSLFDLAQRIHLDIESVLFSFGVGGLTVAIYEWIFPVRHQTASFGERQMSRHRFHIVALLTAPVLFVALSGATRLNPIYSAILALMGAGLATCYCRPDLMSKMMGSAFLFLGFYFAYFLTLLMIYPDYVRLVWNLPAISGVLVLGIPVEELAFALSLGFFWSSVYEHLKWQKLTREDRRSEHRGHSQRTPQAPAGV
jgi:lycopene cyclase-like protein